MGRHLDHDDAVLVITGDAPAAALTFGHGPAPYRGSDAGVCDEVDLDQRVATAHLQRIPAQEPPIPPTFLVDMNGATPTHSDGEPHTGAAPSLFVFDLQVLLPLPAPRPAVPATPCRRHRCVVAGPYAAETLGDLHIGHRRQQSPISYICSDFSAFAEICRRVVGGCGSPRPR